MSGEYFRMICKLEKVVVSSFSARKVLLGKEVFVVGYNRLPSIQ